MMLISRRRTRLGCLAILSSAVVTILQDLAPKTKNREYVGTVQAVKACGLCAGFGGVAKWVTDYVPTCDTLLDGSPCLACQCGCANCGNWKGHGRQATSIFNENVSEPLETVTIWWESQDNYFILVKEDKKTEVWFNLCNLRTPWQWRCPETQDLILVEVKRQKFGIKRARNRWFDINSSLDFLNFILRKTFCTYSTKEACEASAKCKNGIKEHTTKERCQEAACEWVGHCGCLDLRYGKELTDSEWKAGILNCPKGNPLEKQFKTGGIEDAHKRQNSAIAAIRCAIRDVFPDLAPKKPKPTTWKDTIASFFSGW